MRITIPILFILLAFMVFGVAHREISNKGWNDLECWVKKESTVIRSMKLWQK